MRNNGSDLNGRENFILNNITTSIIKNTTLSTSSTLSTTSLKLSPTSISNTTTLTLLPLTLSICGSELLLGGYKIFNDTSSLERKQVLPNHFRLFIGFHFCAIDKCSTDHLNIFIDNILIYSFGPPFPSCNPILDDSGVNGCEISLPNNTIIAYFIINSGLLCGNSLVSDVCYRIEIQLEHNITEVIVFMKIPENVVGSYWGISNFSIAITDSSPLYSCSENCTSCVSTVCKTCPSSSYFIQDSYCLNTCNKGYLLDNYSNICYICHSSCLTCDGNTPISCLSCNGSLGLFLNDGMCVSTCPIGKFSDNINFICSFCNNTCQTCLNSSNSSCLSCPPSYIFGSNCLESCPSNTYYNNSLNQCMICNSKCSTCFGPLESQCLSCENNNSCDSDIELFCTVTEIDNPNQFLLSYYPDIYTADVYKRLANDTLISIINDSNIRVAGFILDHSNINQTSFLIKISYDHNSVFSNGLINIKIQNSTENVNFKGRNYSITMRPFHFCSSTTYYDEKTNKCHEKIIITYDWKYSKSLNLIDFTFNQYNDRVIQGLSNNLLSFEIPKLSIQNYNYSIDIQPEINSFSFILESNVSIVGGIILNVIANKSMITAMNLFNNTINLIEKNFSIKLMENYILLTSTQVIINRTLEASTIGSIAASASFYVGIFNKPGSSFVLRGIILSYLIQLQRYDNINYPPNSLSIFKNKKQRIFLDDFLIEVSENFEIAQRFRFYGVTPSFLNNVSDDIFQMAFIFFFGIIFKKINSLIEIYFKKYRFYSIFNKFEVFLIWNLLISIFFSKYLFLCFHVGIALKYKTTISSNCDFALFVIVIIIIIVFPLHFAKLTSLFMENDLEKNASLNQNQILPICLKDNDNLNEIALQLINDKSPIFRKIYLKPKKEIEEEKDQLKIKNLVNWNNLQDYQTPKYKHHNNPQINLSLNSENVQHKKSKNEKNQIYAENFHIENNDVNMLSGKCIYIEKNSDFTQDCTKEKEDFNKTKRKIQEFKDNNISIDKSNKNFNFENKYLEIQIPNSFKTKKSGNSSEQDKKTYDLTQKENKIYDKSFSKVTPLFNPSKIEKCKEKNEKNIVKKTLIHIILVFKKLWSYCYDISEKTKFKNKYKILWKDFKLRKRINLYYFTFDLIRFALIGIFSVLLFEYTIIQIILTFSINFLFGIYLVTVKPFCGKVALYCNILNELCININYFSSLFIAILDRQENLDINLRINLGWVMVFSYLILLYSIVAYSCFYLIISIKALFISKM